MNNNEELQQWTLYNTHSDHDGELGGCVVGFRNADIYGQERGSFIDIGSIASADVMPYHMAIEPTPI
jgi:hypothetical protein